VIAWNEVFEGQAVLRVVVAVCVGSGTGSLVDSRGRTGMGEVLLEERGVRITTLEVQIGSQRYFTSRITGVQHRRVGTGPRPPQALAAVVAMSLFFVIFLGLPGLLLAAGIAGIAYQGLHEPNNALYDGPVIGSALVLATLSTLLLGPLGLALAIPAAMLFARLGRRYVVTLETVDGRTALVTRDGPFASLVRATVEEALWERTQLRRTPRRAGHAEGMKTARQQAEDRSSNAGAVWHRVR
jgi:hypothetical protein